MQKPWEKLRQDDSDLDGEIEDGKACLGQVPPRIICGSLLQMSSASVEPHAVKVAGRCPRV